MNFIVQGGSEGRISVNVDVSYDLTLNAKTFSDGNICDQLYHVKNFSFDFQPICILGEMSEDLLFIKADIFSSKLIIHLQILSSTFS